MNIYKSKKEYENMPLPENLESIMEMSIRQANRGYNKKSETIWWKFALKVTGIAVSAIMASIIIISNVSKDFVMAASNVPVLGRLVSIVTWKDYEEENDMTIISVRVPKLESASEDSFKNRINSEINDKINDVLEDAEQRAKEYKKAFLDTGGKEEEWYRMEMYVDYEVKCENSEILSFVITTSESYASVYTNKYYYNIDIQTGKELSLKELLGPDYVEKSNNIIKNSIEERVKQGDIFFGYGDSDDLNIAKFETITDETKFYINEKRQVVIVFDKYEIAPGYMGFVEFVIE